MTTDPLYINQAAGLPEYNASELRRAMGAALLGGVAHRLGSRQGVRPGLAVASLAGTTWTVHSHPAIIYPGLTSTAAAYWVAIPDASGSTLPADGTNPRKDILVARVYDDDEDSLGRRDCDVEYVAGAPAVAPVEPAVPAGAMKLATITVPASGQGAPTIEVNAAYTVASGGILPVRNAAERPADGLYDGLPVWRQDTHVLELWDGAQWRPVSDEQFVRKTADQTYTGSAFIDDNELKFDVVAGNTYTFEALLFAHSTSASGAGDIQVRFSFPAGTMSFGGVGGEVGMLDGTTRGPGQWVAQIADGASPSSAIPFGLSTTQVATTMRLKGIFRATADGVVKLQWAQVAASNATTVRTDSYIEAKNRS